MLNEAETSRPASPPPLHDYDKFNFRLHVLNLLNLIHSNADTAAVSQEAVQLRLAFHEARSEADKIVGSNLGVKEQEIVIAKLTKQVNAKKEFLEQLRKTNTLNGQNGHTEEDAMQIDTSASSS